MKTIKNNSEKLELKVELEEGVEKILTIKKLTMKIMREISKIAKNEEYDNFDKLSKQMVLLFGGEEEDYDEFTIYQMHDLMNEAMEYVKNPKIKAEQKET